MHACGHDGHTAILLRLAKFLIANPQKIPGKIILLFQPAEEFPPGGALDIVNSGVLGEVKYIFGSHLTNQLPLCKIGIRPGNIMASIDCFSVELTGKGGHGSTPHHCIDPIVAGAHLITAWQTIISRNIDPMEPAVLTIGTFKSGSSFNIIPEKAVITGSIRCMSETVRMTIEARFKDITQGICNALGVTYTLNYEHGYPVLTCDAKLVDKVKDWVNSAFGVHTITGPPMNMWSEDFAYYGRVAALAYFLIGARNEERGLVCENHNPHFDFDEEAMIMGVKTYLAILENINN
jgi:amidohydrolase